jgi:hypothetical protein
VKAIRRMVKIKDPNQLILTDLPFRVGDEIEVLILGKEKNEQDVENLRSLFRETQSLPQMKSINESDIKAETEAYRSGK